MTDWRRSFQMKSKLGSITMCAKAGRLSIGMDMMKDACKSDNAKGVFAASDISEKSKRLSIIILLSLTLARTGLRAFLYS